MSPVLPDAASLKSTVAALNSLADRVAALESDLAALKAQLVKGDELRARLGALEEFAELNRLALRSLLTIQHPSDQDGWTAASETSQLTARVHSLIHLHLNALGGRAELPGEEIR